MLHSSWALTVSQAQGVKEVTTCTAAASNKWRVVN
jgi:hypothetical protein